MAYHPFGGKQTVRCVRRSKVCLVSPLWRRILRLNSAFRLHHCLPEPPPTSFGFPLSHLTFMAPQTGPNNPGLESRRRRGCRSQYLPLRSEDASEMQCRWIGCGIQLAYNQQAISRHVNMTHRGKSFPVICQWERPDGGVCGTIMQPNHLRRHILDIHTTLMVAWCELCGESQRRDVMSRHKKTCERRNRQAARVE